MKQPILLGIGCFFVVNLLVGFTIWILLYWCLVKNKAIIQIINYYCPIKNKVTIQNSNKQRDYEIILRNRACILYCVFYYRTPIVFSRYSRGSRRFAI